MMNKAAVNLQIHFIAGLWTNGSNILSFEKKDSIKTCVADGFPFMDINMIYSHKWGYNLRSSRGKESS